jgi:hypothetical protein
MTPGERATLVFLILCFLAIVIGTGILISVAPVPGP